MSRYDWSSPAARLVLSAALDSLAQVGYGPATLAEIRRRSGAAGRLVDDGDLEEVVACALEGVRLFTRPERTGTLRGDLVALLRPWLTDRGRDERAVTAVLSAAEWSPRLRGAVAQAFDRPLAQAVGATLLGAVQDGQLPPARVQTLNWLLRGVALDRLRAAHPRSPVDLDQLVDHLLGGLGTPPAAA